MPLLPTARMRPAPEWEVPCEKILDELCELDKDDKWFWDPVDWEGLKIPDYPKIITQVFSATTQRASTILSCCH